MARLGVLLICRAADKDAANAAIAARVPGEPAVFTTPGLVAAGAAAGTAPAFYIACWRVPPLVARALLAQFDGSAAGRVARLIPADDGDPRTNDEGTEVSVATVLALRGAQLARPVKPTPA